MSRAESRPRGESTEAERQRAELRRVLGDRGRVLGSAEYIDDVYRLTDRGK